MINYNGKMFRLIESSTNGEVSSETKFYYKQREDIVWATYKGGVVRYGTLIGLVSENGHLHFNYQHINQNNEIQTGVCSSEPEFLPNGRIRLLEKWQWTSGEQTKGESIVEEI